MQSHVPQKKAQRVPKWYYKIDAWILAIHQLKNSKVVLAVILDIMGNHKTAWPTQRTLARICGMNRRTLQLHLDFLISHQLLNCRCRGWHRSNQYHKGATFKRLEKCWIRNKHRQYGSKFQEESRWIFEAAQKPVSKERPSTEKYARKKRPKSR
jgi:hypothetical protein